MKLYNTLTRQIDTITPLDAPRVTVYTCGPTVYDFAHIGHWFNYVRMDTLIRVLAASGYQPDWVMNITDVGHLVSDADDGEDKLEKGAKREGKTAWQVAEFYTADFLECMALLHINTPHHLTKATEHIQEQIALIERLQAKGFTYTVDDGVYYDTSRFEGYAAFARLDLDSLQAGARVSFNSQKRNPSDFALWKFSPAVVTGDKRRDMEWDSPFVGPDGEARKGFPGWHIECSAMAMKYLGDTLDIHAGGIDHIPVHHTNEIAQSEAATGQRFAEHWMHGNHVMVNGDKISKSLGNGTRLQSLIKQGFSAEAVRLNILESHYRSQSQFSLDSLQAAANRLTNLRAMAVLRYQVCAQTSSSPTFTYSGVADQLSNILAHDLDTPGALAYLSQIESQVSISLVSSEHVQAFSDMLQKIDNLLGLQLHDEPDISHQQAQILQRRAEARADQNWSASDTYRDQLAQDGIGLRDTAHGQIWYRL